MSDFFTEVALVKVFRALQERFPSWTPEYMFHKLTIPQLIILSTPDGRVSEEQAFDIVNERRARKGLEPLASIGGSFVDEPTKPNLKHGHRV